MFELIIFVGLQASGKTTFYREVLSETHVHVSKDNFPKARYPERKQIRLLREAFGLGRSVALDNTNVSIRDRSNAIALAKEFGIPIRCYMFESTLESCLERNSTRTDKASVPRVGLLDATKRYQEPSLEEGFSSLHRVTGGPGQYRIESCHEP